MFLRLWCWEQTSRLRSPSNALNHIETIVSLLFWKIQGCIFLYINLVRIGRIPGIRAFTKHSLLCWPWPHHPIAQFQCYGRILSERLTCQVDWTRSIGVGPTYVIRTYSYLGCHLMHEINPFTTDVCIERLESVKLLGLVLAWLGGRDKHCSILEFTTGPAPYDILGWIRYPCDVPWHTERSVTPYISDFDNKLSMA